MKDKTRIISIIAAAFVCLIPAGAFADSDKNYYSGVGIEGFTDRYREPGGLESNATYGAITGNYTQYFNRVFGALDGRASYGKNRYSHTTDGTKSDIPQWEFDGRIRGGATFALGEDSVLSPYVGVGLRYFVDNGKGVVTDRGYAGYDRRIMQAYVPLGVTYTIYGSSGWFVAPNVEYDALFWGKVNSRLHNAGAGFYNINNTQTSGYGIRGELMFGQTPQNSFGWEFGPFVRYWNVKDSNVVTAPNGSQWVEPQNDRLQIGIALKVFW